MSLKRKTPLHRKTWMRRRNPERAAKRYDRDFGELAAYVRTLPCASCEAPAPSDPAHVKSRGAGGHAWLENGHGNIIPLCRLCHNAQHASGWSKVFWGGRDEVLLRARAVGERFKTFVEKT